jgi:ADP-ribose pyrophosphatase YjhB (NUDIX family)
MEKDACLIQTHMNDNDIIWKPHVTVAAVVEQEGKFLMIEEDTPEGRVFNQPAGHLEPNEALVSAMLRETLEESAWVVEPVAFIGVYRWCSPGTNQTYVRFAFAAKPVERRPEQSLDTGIVAAHWMDLDSILEKRALHRGPQVMQCIEDYRNRRLMPLDTIKDLAGL